MTKIKSLLDIPGLEKLSLVCKQFNIEFTAYGGLIKNLARRLNPTSDELESSVDLFHLTPSMSDIDIVHNGDSKLTPWIMEAIYNQVFAAECFRWQLRSVEDNAVFWEATKANNIIPVNLMSLSTNSHCGIKDTWGGRKDIQDNQYRFIRNGFYHTSPLYKAGRDIELFSALLYLRVLRESETEPQEAEDSTGHNLTGLNTAKQIVKEAQNIETVITLQESAYLRTRLIYLLKSLCVASLSHMKFNQTLTDSGLYEFFDYLGNYNSSLKDRLMNIHVESYRILLSSARLGGDIFRLPDFTGPWVSGEPAATQLQSHLEGVDTLHEHSTKLDLAPGFEVLLASPSMPLIEGTSEPGCPDGANGQEFIHFAVPLPDVFLNSSSFEDETSLTSVICLTRQNEEGKTVNTFYPVPTVCTVSGWQSGTGTYTQLLMARINCLRILEEACRRCKPYDNSRKNSLRIFLLRWKGVD